MAGIYPVLFGTGIPPGNNGSQTMADTFKEWLAKCDSVVSGKLGFGLHDLPDANWRGYFDDGLSPGEAADCAFDDQWCDEIPAELWYSVNR